MPECDILQRWLIPITRSRGLATNDIQDLMVQRRKGNPDNLQIDYYIELDSKYLYLFLFFNSSEFATRTMPKTLQRDRT